MASVEDLQRTLTNLQRQLVSAQEDYAAKLATANASKSRLNGIQEVIAETKEEISKIIGEQAIANITSEIATQIRENLHRMEASKSKIVEKVVIILRKILADSEAVAHLPGVLIKKNDDLFAPVGKTSIILSNSQSGTIYISITQDGKYYLLYYPGKSGYVNTLFMNLYSGIRYTETRRYEIDRRFLALEIDANESDISATPVLVLTDNQVADKVKVEIFNPNREVVSGLIGEMLSLCDERIIIGKYMVRENTPITPKQRY